MRVSIICIGNEYQLDDGFGPAVARYLEERYEFSTGVCVLDRAMMGFDIVPDLQACDTAVVVDALDGTGAASGTIFSFSPDDMAGAGEMMSLHQVRFADVLAAARVMGASIDRARCFGVQVEDMGAGTLQRGLSEPVASAVAPVARMVSRYLRDVLGLSAVDLWRATRDPRAVLDDPVGYVCAALDELGFADARMRSSLLDQVQPEMRDFEADDLIERAIRGPE